MAWIRADITDKFVSLSDISLIGSILERKLDEKHSDNSINLNFDNVYKNSVYTNWNSILGLLKYLEYRNTKIDIVLFTGHAGNGHRAPTRSIAKKIAEKSTKNIIIIDILSLFSASIANINDKAWVFLSRYNFGQEFWSKFIRGEINPKKTGFDIAPVFKILYTERLRKLMNKLSPSIVISTYPYSNAIFSQIVKDTPSIKFAGIVVTDTEMLGFAMSAYGNVNNLHYFVSSENTWRNGLKVYPYLKDATHSCIGTNPCFFDKEPNNCSVIKDTVLFIPGSAEGLGMGIKALPKLAEFCKKNDKKLICISGLGRPYKFAQKVRKQYKNIMSLFSYVASSDLKNLMASSEVIIGKAGGNMSSEFVSKSGCKIFFASIKGQETDNAAYYSSVGVATDVGNDINELFKAILDKPYTPSIYESGLIKKSAVDTVVDTILPYLS